MPLQTKQIVHKQDISSSASSWNNPISNIFSMVNQWEIPYTPHSGSLYTMAPPTNETTLDSLSQKVTNLEPVEPVGLIQTTHFRPKP